MPEIVQLLGSPNSDRIVPDLARRLLRFPPTRENATAGGADVGFRIGPDTGAADPGIAAPGQGQGRWR